MLAYKSLIIAVVRIAKIIHYEEELLVLAEYDVQSF